MFPLTGYITSHVARVVMNSPGNAGDISDVGLIPELKDSLEEEMATHFSVFAWRIPWTEELSGLQFMRSQRVGYN